MANNPNNVEATTDAVEQMEVDPSYLQLVTAIIKNSGTTINDMLQTAGRTPGDNPTEGDIQYLGNLFRERMVFSNDPLIAARQLDAENEAKRRRAEMAAD